MPPRPLLSVLWATDYRSVSSSSFLYKQETGEKAVSDPHAVSPLFFAVPWRVFRPFRRRWAARSSTCQCNVVKPQERRRGKKNKPNSEQFEKEKNLVAEDDLVLRKSRNSAFIKAGRCSLEAENLVDFVSRLMTRGALCAASSSAYFISAPKNIRVQCVSQISSAPAQMFLWYPSSFDRFYAFSFGRF